MDADAYDMVLAYVNDKRLVGKRQLYENGGRVDMCKAIEDLVADKIEEGRELGIELGLERGIERGLEQGILIIKRINCTL